jgi:hypothetical protein
MKHEFCFLLTSFSTYLLLTACQFGTGVAGKYVCRFDTTLDIWSYSIIMNFMSDGYVELKYETKDPKRQAMWNTPEEAPYTVKDGRITIKSQSGEQVFKIRGNELIGSGGGMVGRECPKN